jgi:hypothetical protein
LNSISIAIVFSSVVKKLLRKIRKRGYKLLIRIFCCTPRETHRRLHVGNKWFREELSGLQTPHARVCLVDFVGGILQRRVSRATWQDLEDVNFSGFYQAAIR